MKPRCRRGRYLGSLNGPRRVNFLSSTGDDVEEVSASALPLLPAADGGAPNSVAVQGLAKDVPSDSQRAINAAILFTSFAYILLTVVTIDSGMARGWTFQEQLYRLPYDNWRTYEDALQMSPLQTKTTINVIIYLLGDWLSQTLFKGENILNFDASRTLKNGLIGACFGPVVHLYYEWSDSVLPVEIGINRLYKIIMDQTLYLSVKCSVYIAFVGLLSGEGTEEVKENGEVETKLGERGVFFLNFFLLIAKECTANIQRRRSAPSAVTTKIGPIMFTAWKFWPLVHCCTYSIIPARHRVLWVNCVDLFWNAILATKTRAAIPDSESEGARVEMLGEAEGEADRHE